MMACLLLFLDYLHGIVSLMEHCITNHQSLAHQLRSVGLRHRNGQQQSLDGQIREATQEQERQAQSFRQGISPASGGSGELISGLLGLLDLTPSSCTETPEEAEFRRLMQRKRKNKGFRI